MPPPAAAGPPLCLLDVIATDPNLKPGQRETLRIVYRRFRPNATESANATHPPELTVGDALERDRDLKRGQREAIRTMYASYRGSGRK